MAAFAVTCLILPVNSQANTPLDKKEVNCIALAIQKEAGNQSVKGMQAIGHVIINRTKSIKYPTTPCKVVYQKKGSHCQFSWVCHKLKSINISELAFNAARSSLQESDFTHSSISFHVIKVHPNWKNLTPVFILGDHIFYKEKNIY